MRATGGQAAESLVDYFGELLERTDSTGATGSVIETVSAACESGAMDLEEVVATLVLLMAAGFETTRYTITGGIIALVENREQWALAQRQVADAGTISAAAVEEMLRHQGPIHGALPRVAVEPLRFGDTEIPAGEPVVSMVAAASRDPAAYDDPDALRIDRRGPRALGFGAGPHYCLGFALAKHEVNHAISTVLRRFPELHIVEPPGSKGSFNVRGPAGLRVRRS
jgi:cytochrome P450 PksS